MSDITLLPSAKVPLIYPDTNGMTTEWYRFFWNIYGFTGTGVVPVNKGGTGLDTIGDHQLIIGNANNVFEPASLSSASIAITYPAGYVNLELGTSGVTPGTYGSASQVGVFTVNAYGVLTAASNTSIGIDASQIISGTLPVVRGGTGQSTYTNGQLLIGNSTGNTLTKATLTAGTGISVTNGAGSITIGNTGVLSVSGTAPVVSSGGATPAISMAAANTTTNGYLTSTDWNTFNNKGSGTVTSITSSTLTIAGTSAIPTVNLTSGIVTAGTTGSATLIPVITVDTYGRVTTITTAANPQGTVTSVTGTAPVVSSGGATPAISMAAATGSVNGYLTSTDWTTFNGKAPSVTFTTGYVPFGQGTTTLNQSANLTFDGTNLGIGRTITAGNLSNDIQIGLAGSLAGNLGGNQIYMISNAYYSTGWKYLKSDTAGQYFINGNTHTWRIAPSGTAAGALTWTDTMVLDSSGLKANCLIYPQQAATVSAPTYVKGAIYFDTTLNKLRVGGATAWETITSV